MFMIKEGYNLFVKFMIKEGYNLFVKSISDDFKKF